MIRYSTSGSTRDGEITKTRLLIIVDPFFPQFEIRLAMEQI